MQLQVPLVKDPQTQNYLDYLADRLATKESRLKDPEILLFASEQPFAVPLTGEKVAISLGLLKRTSNEAQMAFIVAHELAHEQLRHEISADQEVAKNLELEADERALGILALAGYDLYAAVSIFNQTHFNLHPTDSQHQTPQNRSAQLHHYIKESGWLPPGTITRRPFQNLKHHLFPPR